MHTNCRSNYKPEEEEEEAVFSFLDENKEGDLMIDG